MYLPHRGIRRLSVSSGIEMRRTAVTLLLIALPVGVGACGGGSFTPAASPEPLTIDVGTLLSQSVGRVDVTTFAKAMQKVVIGRYRFSLARREEQFRSLNYQTLWVVRPPTAEEHEAGVFEARHRVVIQGRRSGGGTSQGGAILFRMTLRVENQARTSSADDWRSAAALGGTLDQDMRAMVSELQRELREGQGG